MEAVDREVAAKEVNTWLDAKKISPSKRAAKEASIEQLITAIVDGDLILNDNNQFVQKLKFPGPEAASVKELVFKQRILINEVQNHFRNQKIQATDFDGRIACYIQALTGQPNGVISKMESTDYDIAQSIAIFFV